MEHSFMLKYTNPIQSIMRAGDLYIGCETLSGTFTSYDGFNEKEYTEKLKKKIEDKGYEFISIEFTNKNNMLDKNYQQVKYSKPKRKKKTTNK